MVKNRVLIIDSDKDSSKAKECVNSLGYDALTCSSLEEAKSAFTEFSPHLVITSLNLSGCDDQHKGIGYEFAEWVKDGGSNCPVIVLTSDSTLKASIDSFLHGCSSFLTKPVNFDALAVNIIRLSNIHRLCMLSNSNN
jgi:DNA-binding NtrC family response regulator